VRWLSWFYRSASGEKALPGRAIIPKFTEAARIAPFLLLCNPYLFAPCGFPA
jgi:hypothetical protein